MFKMDWVRPLLAAWLLSGAVASAAETLIDETFESPFVSFPSQENLNGAFRCSGALPNGWKDESDSRRGVHVHYAGAGDAYGGKQALRIEMAPVGEDWNTSQVSCGTIPIVKGRIYTFSLAMRCNGMVSVDLNLHSSSSPQAVLVKHTMAPGPEWAMWEFSTVATQDDPAARVSFRLMREGVVDMDDLRAESMDRAEFDRAHPARVGNLLETTRFPLGAANGWTLPRSEAANFRVIKDPAGPSGSPVLELAGTSAGPLRSPPLVLRSGAMHTVSFWAKAAASDGQSPVTLSADLQRERYKENQTVVKESFTVTDKWQRFSMSGETAFSASPAYLSFSSGQTVLLDAIQVEEGGKPTDYASAKPVEVCVVPTRNYGIFFEGEPLAFKVAATGRWEAGATVKARIVDLFERATDLPAIALTQSPFETTITVPLESIPLGFYRLELQAVNGGGKVISPYGEAVATRILRPRLAGQDAPDSPFGIHICANEKQAAMAESLGFKWVRTHDAASNLTQWFFVEPKPGEWTWQDAKVDIFRQHHLMILGLLDTTPAWASRSPSPKTRTFVPKDWDAWSNYCRRVVEHYRGKIDTWEVWNEPYVSFFMQDVVNGKVVHATPEQYATVAKLADQAAKQSNPDCTVITAIGPVPAWAAGCTKAGAVNIGDLYSHHQYSPQIPGGPNDAVARAVAAWRQELPEVLRTKTVWTTEGGPTVEAHTFYSHLPLAQARTDARFFADFVARYYLSCQALGVPKFFLYSFHGHSGLGNPHYMLVDGDGTLQPLATAVSVLAWHIEGKHFVRMVPVGATAWAYLFTDGKSSVAAVVTVSGKALSLKKIEGAECRDLCGNTVSLPATLGPETCYLTVSGGPDALAKALSEK